MNENNSGKETIEGGRNNDVTALARQKLLSHQNTIPSISIKKSPIEIIAYIFIIIIVFGFLIAGSILITQKLFYSNRSNEIVLTKNEYNSLVTLAKKEENEKENDKTKTTKSSNLNTTAYVTTNYNKPIEMDTSYVGAIQYASHLTGVSYNVINRIIHQESRGNPLAISSAGAVGLMQIQPWNAGRVAYKMLTNKNITPTQGYLQNGWNNIVLGSLYLKYLLQQFSNYPPKVKLGLALASYNWGIANVQRILSFNKVNNWKEFCYVSNKYFPYVTKSYVSNIEQPLSV